MKKILLCAAFIAVSFTSIAQVGIGTINPHDSAVLEIRSIEKGLLIPRMTIAQRNKIAVPVPEGLMVYVKGADGVAGSFTYYDGANWKELFRADLTTPKIISGVTGNLLDENSGKEQVVYTILVNTDITGEITYFLEGRGDTRTEWLSFDEINKNKVILIADPDHELQEIYDFKVKAVSAAGKPSEWKDVSFSILDINEPPVANGDAETVINNADPVPTNINVIDNDDDVDDGHILKLTDVKAETGLVTINDDEKSVNYTPKIGFNGTDIINYTVFDGEHTDTGGILDITVVHTLIGRTGRFWMDRNLGASQVATSSDDVDSYGDLYQWGRASDGHEKRGSSIEFKNSNPGNEGAYFIVGSDDWLNEAEDDRWWLTGKGEYDPCPAKFRVPMLGEMNVEISSSNQEYLRNYLKFPLSGWRDPQNLGFIAEKGIQGRYWLSDAGRAMNWQFHETPVHGNDYTAGTSIDKRAMGYAVRCIKQLDNENQ